MDPAAPILSTITAPHQVDLAYNWSEDEWFIAFVRALSQTPPGTSNDIHGQKLDQDGNKAGGKKVLTNSALVV
jgi:hypothetical protein